MEEIKELSGEKKVWSYKELKQAYKRLKKRTEEERKQDSVKRIDDRLKYLESRDCEEKVFNESIGEEDADTPPKWSRAELKNIASFDEEKALECGKHLILCQFVKFGSIKRRFEEYYDTLLLQIPIEKQIELALFHIRYNGICVLEKYHLTPQHKKNLRLQACKELAEFLPFISKELITLCVKENNKKDLLYIFYQRFSGKYRLFKEVENIEKLFMAVEQNDFDQIDELFQLAIKQQEAYFLESGWERLPLDDKSRPPYWEQDKKSAEEKVYFSHGGGYFHILEFLIGKSEGYQLERYDLKDGKGIQVSPNEIQVESERDIEYANREMRKKNHDFPAKLVGKIKCGFLDAAPNIYEAGLRPQFVDEIEEVKLTRLSLW